MAAAKKNTDSGSFHRSMRVLEAIAEEGNNLRFAELEKNLGLPKATLNRLLGQLLEENLVMYDDNTQSYALGFRLLALARKSWEQMDIRRLAKDQLQHLASASNESVQLAIQAEMEMVYVDCIECTQSVRLSVRVGEKIPLYCSGTGKAWLAFRPLPEQRTLIKKMRFAAITPNTLTTPKALEKDLINIQQQGYAIDREEHFVGVCCVASPIVDAQGHAIAALSVAAPSFRVDESVLQQWALLLNEAAQNISARLPPSQG